MMNTQLVVIGGGPGGYAAAFLAADLGLPVALVDLEPQLGGVCLLRGCIPSKALLHVAKVMADAKHLADWGVSYGAPGVDVAKLRARKEKVISTLTGGLKQIAAKRGVKVIRARASFEDSQTLRLAAPGDCPNFCGQAQHDRENGTVPLASEERLRFEHCIIATGSRPAWPAALKLTTPRLMDSTGALDLPEVPESLLVVGGGYIGLEMGTVYAALGSRVSVVEMTDGLLPGVDRDLVKPLHKRLQQQFAGIHLSTKVAALAERGKVVEAVLETSGKTTTEKFSRVLVSVGRRPNSDSLGLDKTQVKVDSQGFIEVDARRRTADPHILAIGDVAGQPMLAHKAAHEGKAAVEALAGQPVAFEPRAIPAVVFTEPEIAWAGLTDNEARQAGRRVEVAQFPWAASGRAQSMAQTDGLTKWLIEPDSGRLLGCGIVGAGAGELIAEAVLAIEMGATARDVVETIHPHPTLSETLGAAAEVYFGTATDLYRPKRPGKA
jgi:dihydrolipoamide dehydrogenase